MLNILINGTNVEISAEKTDLPGLIFKIQGSNEVFREKQKQLY